MPERKSKKPPFRAFAALSGDPGALQRIEGICPFFQRYNGKPDRNMMKIYCDCAVVKCPDAAYRRQVLYGYCAHPTNWRRCQFYRLMEAYFLERNGERRSYEESNRDADE